MSEKELAKIYNPSEVEDSIYSIWLASGAFEPDDQADGETFTVVIPPPNVTGILHIGHVLNNTIQDVMIRRARMQGKITLWLPGTDHASIATEAKVTKMLKDKGIGKQDITREEFLKHAWEWTEKYGGIILQQLKKLGSSCDWKRTIFTMDERYTRAVLEVFVKLYNDGLIYRGKRMINWDPAGQTALSDEEVIHKEIKGHLWHFRYPIKDSDQYLVVATTRPETMLGDTGVAVHPEDDRYESIIGKTVILPLAEREIPVFADEFVDREFGTGCVKVTPAHDLNDFNMGKRHNLETVNILHPDGTLNNNVPSEFQGMDRFKARKAVLKALEKQGLLEKMEDHVHKVGHSERTNAVVEPYLSKQWFVKMAPLAEKAINSVADGSIKFYPERWVKTYNHWLENIHDWCISRQLYWGHRIPVWYCRGNDIGECKLECKNPIVSIVTPDCCPACGSRDLVQDPDVLDTWFSSWLWPFATLGWPLNEKDVNKYYPTQDLVTGPDIIFFWVARMIMSGLYLKNDIPFSNVYFTGIVRDHLGRKMSKSLGNSPDPLALIDKFGADALRVGMLLIAPQGLDILFTEDRIEQGRNFMNKLWNSARFVLMNLEKSPRNFYEIPEKSLDIADKWILSRLNSTIGRVDQAYKNYKLNEAVKIVHDYVWSEYCDWYIEMTKVRLYGLDDEKRETAMSVSVHVLRNILKLLHPYTPFITEELWTFLKRDEEGLLLVSSWPETNEKAIDEETEKIMALLQESISTVRNIRTNMNIAPGKKASLFVRGDNASTAILEKHSSYLDRLAKIETITCGMELKKPAQSATGVVRQMEFFIPLEGLINIDQEIARLEKQIFDYEGRLNAVNRKLDNENFVSRAPEKVVVNEKRKQNEYQQSLAKLRENLFSIQA